jgi:3-oxoacyl-[acyl-carrier protein] reductase
MQFGIQNKRALITGASRGLGEGIARSLAQEGVRVILTGRTKKDLDAVLQSIGGRQKGHMVIVADLTKKNKPTQIISQLTKNKVQIDIVVNNLGGDLLLKDPFCTILEWQKLWRLNMEVAIEINNLVIPTMREKKWGRIVNISSIASLENQGAVPYCSIKAALTAYSRSMGRFLAPDGIIMTSVLPGAVYTKGGYWEMASKKKIAHVKEYLDKRMAIKRFGTLKEIGDAVAFLCSDNASFCVGTTMVVDGGQGRSFQT